MKFLMWNKTNWKIILISFLFCGVVVPLSSNMSKGIFTVYSLNPFLDLIKIVLLIFMLFVVLVKVSESHILYIILIAFLIRVLVAIAISFFGFLPYAFDTQWDVISKTLVEDWQHGNIHLSFESSVNVRYYTILTTFVYLLFGYNPIYMQLLNAFFGAFTLIFVYKTSILLFNKNVGKMAVSILAIWPTYILFSSMQMRDSLAILLISAFTLYFIRWIRGLMIFDLVIVLILFCCNVLIRFQNAALLVCSVAPFAFYVLFKKSKQILFPVVIISATFILVPLLYYLYSHGFFNIAKMDYIVQEVNYRSSGDSGYLKWIVYRNWLDIILYSPLRFIYFVYSPFPWDVHNITQLLAAIESLVLLYFSIQIFINYKVIMKSSNSSFLVFTFLMICLLGLLASSLIDSNVGTAIRHKIQYIYFIFIGYAAIKSIKKSEATSAE